MAALVQDIACVAVARNRDGGEPCLCDKPISVRTQIDALLKEIRTTLGMAFLFIAHALAVVGEISDEIFSCAAAKSSSETRR